MVCRRMGLLDDAIRDHLELKRRRGADPSEVEREQHEALDPPTGASGEDPEPREAVETDAIGAGPGEAGAAPTGDGPAAAGDAPDEVQETAEIDMKAVLEDDSGEGDAVSASITADERAADVLEETPE